MLLDPYGDNVSKLVLERPVIFSPTLKVDTQNRLLAFWTNNELPYSGVLNSDGTISTAEMVTGGNSTDNMYCGVYDCAAGIVDINHDGKVDMKDVAAAAHAFLSTPSLPSWDPNADVNGDGKVDMKDVGSTAREFQKAFSSRIGCRQMTLSRQTVQSQLHVQTANVGTIKSPNLEPPSGFILGLAICTQLLSKAIYVTRARHCNFKLQNVIECCCFPHGEVQTLIDRRSALFYSEGRVLHCLSVRFVSAR
jgi:hypothetical protein